jgi:D-serine/D-alanine/glycine transporter
MPLSKVMPYVAFAFFAIVIYALTLNDDTRIALFVLPAWLIVLGVMYRIKTRRSSKQKQLIANFEEKVAAQNAAAKIYLEKSP